MILIACIIFLFCLIFFPRLRCVVFHPFKTLFYTLKDMFLYFKYKKYNIPKMGNLIAFTALFGKGKTLSCVHHVVKCYLKYNGKKSYSVSKKKWVKNNIVVLSNVELTIPYIKFTSLQQILDLIEYYKKYDNDNDVLTSIYVLGDEFSVQMNSRNFKSNINADVLNSILTCRHYRMSIFYTAQRFNHVDALLRQVTQLVIECDKLWRLQKLTYYDAFELENAVNPTNVKSIRRKCFFVTDKTYNLYDTLACVDNLSHSAKSGDMLSESEIIANQCANAQGLEYVSHLTRKGKKKVG